MGHTSGALRSRIFASSARGLRPDGKSASMLFESCAGEKTTERPRLSWVVAVGGDFGRGGGTGAHSAMPGDLQRFSGSVLK